MELLNACVVAFVAVFVLLTFLALAMHFITLAFPGRSPRTETDAAVFAALSTAVATVIPGARVTRIEEES